MEYRELDEGNAKDKEFDRAYYNYVNEVEEWKDVAAAWEKRWEIEKQKHVEEVSELQRKLMKTQAQLYVTEQALKEANERNMS